MAFHPFKYWIDGGVDGSRWGRGLSQQPQTNPCLFGTLPMASGSSLQPAALVPPCGSSPREQLRCPPLPDSTDAAETSQEVMGWLCCLLGWCWVQDKVECCGHALEQATPM